MRPILSPNPELLLLLLLEQGEHVLLEWAFNQRSEISQSVLFLIESDLLNNKQSQIFRHGTYSEAASVTIEKIVNLLNDKKNDLLGMHSQTLKSLTHFLHNKIPISCSLSSLVEALWSRFKFFTIFFILFAPFKYLYICIIIV